MLDGFQIPLKSEVVKAQGFYLELTPFGYLRQAYMVMLNAELYLYDSKDASKH